MATGTLAAQVVVQLDTPSPAANCTESAPVAMLCKDPTDRCESSLMTAESAAHKRCAITSLFVLARTHGRLRIILDADAFDEVELSLEVVDVLFL